MQAEFSANFNVGEMTTNNQFVCIMLEFCKNVLSKVSFDRHLFAKELNKSVRWLNKEELKALRDWCIGRYGSRYGDLIQDTFHGLALG